MYIQNQEVFSAEKKREREIESIVPLVLSFFSFGLSFFLAIRTKRRYQKKKKKEMMNK
jgi:preprotein translocase subunit YajC